MKRVAFLLTLLMLASIVSLLETGSASTGPFSSVSVSSGSYHAIDLGAIEADKELEIDYSADDDIDVLLMTSGQYSSWQSGGTSHTNSGSDYSDSGDDYVYTIESTDQYYLVLDNSNQNPGGASATGSTVAVSGSTSVVDANPGEVRTRTWAAENSHGSVSLGIVNQGKVIGFDFSCDDSSDGVDFLLMNSLQLSSFNSGSTASWNKHATFLNTCSDSWDYETTSTSHWHVVIENGPEGDADAISGGVTVDIDVDVRSLVPLVEVTDTTRMIDDGDYWKVDLGYTLAGSVFNIWVLFDSHGTGVALDDVDIMVMETSEANDFISGNSADLLGHASGLDTSGSVLGEAWDYRFPSSGIYSIVFDNSDEPSGGAGDGSDIHLELSVTELSIPNLFGNIWTGWSQSRHYVDEGDFVSFDLGTLDVGDDLYYYVGSHSVDGSWWPLPQFDALLMTQENYDLYVSGSSPSLVSDGTKKKQTYEIPLFQNASIPSLDDYWLVFDARDGPSGGADENGDWIFDFMILTDGSSMSSPQALDHHYEDSASNGGDNTPPDEDGDGVSNGRDDCPGTSIGASVGPSGCSSSQLDSDGDGVSDGVDACPGHDDNADSDGDGTPDGCDTGPTDSDGDGVPDSQDQCEGYDDNVDSDGDGVPDGCDSDEGCNINSDCPAGQTCVDGECVDEPDEGCNIDSDCSTDQSCVDGECVGDTPSDSDGDGVVDEDDVCEGHDDTVDTDGDGTPDGCDSFTDSDGDGVADNHDACPGYDDSADSDGDGTPDGCDSVDDSQQNQGGNDDTTTPPVTNDDDSSSSTSESGGLPGFSLVLTLLSMVGALIVSRKKREL